MSRTAGKAGKRTGGNIFDRGIGKEPGRRVGLPVKRLKDGLGRRLLRRERQLQVVNDPVDDGVLREESDDAHLAAAKLSFPRCAFAYRP
jgi:hypothetical protein